MIRFFVFPLILVLSLLGYAQPKEEIRQLDQSHPVERQIGGGETQSYQISLRAGQFALFTLYQQAIDVSLILRTADGNK